MKNHKILIDGFNLALKKGSGIKTYGMTLLDAYKSMGHEVGVLMDNQYVSGENPILDEVNLFDQDEVRPQAMFNPEWFRKSKSLSYMFRKRRGHLIRPSYTEADPNNYLSAAAGEKYAYIENISDIYGIANRIFGLTSKISKFKPQCKPDVFHLTTPWPIKIPGVKTVTTIHDLIPLKAPFTTLDVKNHFYHLFKWAAEYSDLILSVSEHTKKDIIETYGIPEEKVKVTYQSYKQSAQKIEVDYEPIYLKAKKLEAQKYVLFVGNIEPKKNIKALISAMAYVEKGYKLAIVGRKAWMYEQQLVDLKTHLKKKQYMFLDYVSEMELAILYRNATCLVFPSLYEGFGLPVLEAMQNNCPVICADRSSLPEVAGDAALYVNPYEFTEVRDQLQKLIAQPELRQEMIEKGKQRVEFFSPANYVDRLNAAYEGLV